MSSTITEEGKNDKSFSWGLERKRKCFILSWKQTSVSAGAENGDTLYEKNTGVGERMSLSGTGFDRTRRERGKV